MIQIPIWLILMIIWILLSILCGIKQDRFNRENLLLNRNEQDSILAFAILLSPLWFIGAIINQVFVKKWQ